MKKKDMRYIHKYRYGWVVSMFMTHPTEYIQVYFSFYKYRNLDKALLAAIDFRDWIEATWIYPPGFENQGKRTKLKY